MANEPVLIVPWVLAMLGDNPMQSEFACHMGLRAKFFCRNCWVKGRDASGTQQDLQDGLHLNPHDSGDSGSEAGGHTSASGPEDDSGVSGSEAGSELRATPVKKKRATRVKESMADLKIRVTSFLKVSYYYSYLVLMQLLILMSYTERGVMFLFFF